MLDDVVDTVIGFISSYRFKPGTDIYESSYYWDSSTCSAEGGEWG